jgi:cytochrome d ubiquinol oxidase subunit I
MLMLGVCAWHLRRGADEAITASARLLLPSVAVVAVATLLVGHFNGQLMEDQQPMKMAAAEALWNTETSAGFSLFAFGDVAHNPKHLKVNIKVPNTLSLMATNSLDGEVRGMDDIQRDYERRYGPGEYRPIVGVTYWSFRLMVGAGVVMFLIAAFGAWQQRRGRLGASRRFLWLLIPAAALPFIANSTGWIFTEMGRQPWVVFGLLKTDDAGSPTVSSAQVVLTLVGFTLLYAVLGAIGGRLFAREAAHGPEPATSETTADQSDLVLAY